MSNNSKAIYLSGNIYTSIVGPYPSGTFPRCDRTREALYTVLPCLGITVLSQLLPLSNDEPADNEHRAREVLMVR